MVVTYGDGRDSGGLGDDKVVGRVFADDMLRVIAGVAKLARALPAPRRRGWRKEAEGLVGRLERGRE